MKARFLPLVAAIALAWPAPYAAPAFAQHAAAPSARRAAPSVVTHPAWSRHATIYEVNVRQFTPEGTLRAVEAHLPRLRRLGVDVIWLMPVQPIGVKNRKGPLGSPYSVANYTAVHPALGTEADMRALVRSAHRLGMKVLLDWVANHTAFDHPWITAHPEWYVHRADGTISNARDNEGHETDWTDVAELNYDDPALRRAMLGEMRWWLTRTGIDGFRCDVAGGVPMDFWIDARRQLSTVQPALFLLAEAEGPAFHGAFDMTYAWTLHHLLNEVAQGKQPTSALDAYFAADDSVYPRDAYRMAFTSNHDENSWSGTEFERMGANHLPSFVLAATSARSMPLLYTGQEASLNKRLRFFEKDTVAWSDTSLAGFYRAMFDLKHRQPALANGAWGGVQRALRTTGGDRVYAYTRTRGANTVLVAVNFGDAAARAAYEGLARSGRYTDWFTRRAAALGAAGAIEIPAHGYRVLVR